MAEERCACTYESEGDEGGCPECQHHVHAAQCTATLITEDEV